MDEYVIVFRAMHSQDCVLVSLVSGPAGNIHLKGILSRRTASKLLLRATRCKNDRILYKLVYKFGLRPISR